jgi:predicted MPP superfamily phosphohydrolase
VAWTRRQLITRAAQAAAAAGLAAYPLWKARDLMVNEEAIPVARLPRDFDGLRIALMADFHLGPFIPAAFVREAVDRSNALQPDLVLLGGDYILYEARYLVRVMPELGRLAAPLGVYAVTGNHDNTVNRPMTCRELEANGIREINNRGLWLSRGDSRLRLGGIDDLRTGRPDPEAVLDGVSEAESALLLTHNPDFVETLNDVRVGLTLAGHTHGGQVSLPLVGSPFVPSAYGQKYTRGLVRAPFGQVFVTRGIGTVFPPVRLNCPPEIALLTLRQA